MRRIILGTAFFIRINRLHTLQGKFDHFSSIASKNYRSVLTRIQCQHVS